jgi:hypothetical protein
MSHGPESAGHPPASGHQPGRQHHRKVPQTRATQLDRRHVLQAGGRRSIPAGSIPKKRAFAGLFLCLTLGRRHPTPHPLAHRAASVPQNPHASRSRAQPALVRWVAIVAIGALGSLAAKRAGILPSPAAPGPAVQLPATPQAWLTHVRHRRAPILHGAIRPGVGRGARSRRAAGVSRLFRTDQPLLGQRRASGPRRRHGGACAAPEDQQGPLVSRA